MCGKHDAYIPPCQDYRACFGVEYACACFRVDIFLSFEVDLVRCYSVFDHTNSALACGIENFGMVPIVGGRDGLKGIKYNPRVVAAKASVFARKKMACRQNRFSNKIIK